MVSPYGILYFARNSPIGLEKLVAADPDEKNPARVIATYIVDKNLV